MRLCDGVHPTKMGAPFSIWKWAPATQEKKQARLEELLIILEANEKEH